MNLEEKKYDAFISYRHSGVDQFVAETLHRELEAFKLPKSVIRNNKNIKRTKINRVFRDRDELPLACDLAEPINNALRNSEFLIVVCTKRLPESKWCQREIETFIELHGREKVFAVLAEGEPDQAFPDSLKYVKKIVLDENQMEVLQQTEVEPLAADVRGSTKKEIKKKIKEEVLRLLAPMFELGYDDLKQRHRERRLKKIIGISIIAAVFFLIFGVVSSTLAFRIRRQRDQISEQAIKITEQYREALATNNRGLANDSLALLEKGDRIEAIKTAANALPLSNEDQEMPYVSEAEYALAEALHIYENGTKIMPTRLLKNDAPLNFTLLSPSGERILAVDNFGTAILWDAVSGEKITQFTIDEKFYIYEDEFCFLDENRILIPYDSGIGIFDALIGKVTITNNDINIWNVVPAPNRETIAVETFDQIYLLNAKDLSVLQMFSVPEGKSFSSALAFDELNNRIAIAVEPEIGAVGGASVVSLALDDFSNAVSVEVEYGNVSKICFFEGAMYVAANEISEEKKENILEVGNGGIFKVDLATNTVNWTYKETENPIYNLYLSKETSDQLLIFSTYDKVGVLQIADGTLHSQYQYGVKVVATELLDNEAAAVMTSDGKYHVLSIKGKLDFVYDNKFISNSTNIKSFLFGKGFSASFENASNDICINQMITGTLVKEIFKANTTVLSVTPNKNATKALLATLSKENDLQTIVQVVDLTNGKILSENTSSQYDVFAAYLGDSKQFVYFDGKNICYLDENSGEEMKHVTMEDETECKEFSTDGNYMFFEKDQVISCYDIKNQKVAWESTILSTMEYGTLCAFGNTGTGYMIANRQSNQLEWYDGIKDVYSKSFSINVGLIADMKFDQTDQKLYVVNQDGTLTVLDANTFEVISTISDFSNTIKKVINYGDDVIVYGEVNSLLLNESNEKIANISGFEAVNTVDHKWLLSNYEIVYDVPVYNINKLQEEKETYK